jgi:hypothetical protein
MVPWWYHTTSAWRNVRHFPLLLPYQCFGDHPDPIKADAAKRSLDTVRSFQQELDQRSKRLLGHLRRWVSDLFGKVVSLNHLDNNSRSKSKRGAASIPLIHQGTECPYEASRNNQYGRNGSRKCKKCRR